MKKTIFLLLISFSAYAASDLVKTYTKRRKIVTTRKTRESFHLIRKNGRLPQNLTHIELLDQDGKTVFKFQNRDICYGDVALDSLECVNFAGEETLSVIADNGYIAFDSNSLINEFTKRKNYKNDPITVAIFDYLKAQGFKPSDLIEFEKLNSKGKYAIRFINEDVCFGDTKTTSLSCYNAVGFRTFFEQGDLD